MALSEMTGAQRRMLASLLPGHWVGGEGATYRTRQTLLGLERRAIVESALDESGHRRWRLTRYGIREWEAIWPALAAEHRIRARGR